MTSSLKLMALVNAILVVTASALSAPGPKEKPKSGIDIVGEWEVISEVQSGQAIKPFADTMSFATDEKWGRIYDGKPARNCAKFEFDPEAKPATLNLLFTPDTNVAGAFGIVRIDGDTLTFCYNYNSRVRPGKFESAAGSSDRVLVMKRKKK